MAKLKFIKGNSEYTNNLEKNENTFYIVVNDNSSIDFYLGNNIIAKGDIIGDVNTLNEKIVKLDDVYTKSEVDNKYTELKSYIDEQISINITQILNTPT